MQRPRWDYLDEPCLLWCNNTMSLGKGSFFALLGILASTILQPTSIWGATIRDDQPDSSYLALAASPEYAPVGTFVSNWGYTGSATLIAPDWTISSKPAHRSSF